MRGSRAPPGPCVEPGSPRVGWGSRSPRDAWLQPLALRARCVCRTIVMAARRRSHAALIPRSDLKVRSLLLPACACHGSARRAWHRARAEAGEEPGSVRREGAPASGLCLARAAAQSPSHRRAPRSQPGPRQTWAVVLRAPAALLPQALCSSTRGIHRAFGRQRCAALMHVPGAMCAPALPKCSLPLSLTPCQPGLVLPLVVRVSPARVGAARAGPMGDSARGSVGPWDRPEVCG